MNRISMNRQTAPPTARARRRRYEILRIDLDWLISEHHRLPVDVVQRIRIESPNRWRTLRDEAYHHWQSDHDALDRDTTVITPDPEGAADPYNGCAAEGAWVERDWEVVDDDQIFTLSPTCLRGILLAIPVAIGIWLAATFLLAGLLTLGGRP